MAKCAMKGIGAIRHLFWLWVALLVLVIPINQVEALQDPRSLFEHALLSTRKGDLKKALSLWDQFLEVAPKDAAALSNRGNVRLALGDPEGAIKDQTKAIDISPLENDPYLNRGLAEEALLDWSAAARDYKVILERNPDDPSALYNLGNVLASQSDWLEAETLYNKAAIAKVDFVIARSSRALAKYQLGNFDAAEEELRKLILRYPMFADARAALSALLWREGSFGEAESHWAAASGLDPRYRNNGWLLDVRRWPPKPAADLMAFLSLERP